MVTRHAYNDWLMKPFAFLWLGCVLASAAAPAAAPSSGKAAGTPGAPIMIELYSDFQCPHCKLLHDQVLPRLMKDYVATGKVYLIHRQFPLPGHAFARQAAIYACAAARLGRYDQVENLLFQSQEAWSTSGKLDEGISGGLTPAEMKKLLALAKDPAIAAEVQSDVELGQKAHLTQTPTMIITHRLAQYPVAGAVDYDLLRSFLDGELAK
jgi:protein-disulfide isomerase